MATSVITDQRPLSTQELFSALHSKFGANFKQSEQLINLLNEPESGARGFSSYGARLEQKAAEVIHQKELAKYLQEVFADFICALYLASCGLNVPARMLLRRCSELVAVVVSYWDDPANFWAWKDHNSDIQFSTLQKYLQSPGYETYLRSLFPDLETDQKSLLASLAAIYANLSNVVHPKPYNFKTVGATGYAFDRSEFEETARIAQELQELLMKILRTRFGELK